MVWKVKFGVRASSTHEMTLQANRILKDSESKKENKIISRCPCCGGKKFSQTDVLWPSLIKEWRLSNIEANYIDKQQGFACTTCGSNLRSMTLAKAIMSCMDHNSDTFVEYMKNHKLLKLLEVNEAGQLTQFFKVSPYHILAEYPDVDIQKLPYKSNSMDMVVHSDTLEHVEDPVKGLKESLRVLKPGGYTCFTVPLIVDRLNKRRDANRPSFHGSPGNKEYLVYTEYGCDMWTQIFEAGFDGCSLVSIDFPSSIAIVAKKAGAVESRKIS